MIEDKVLKGHDLFSSLTPDEIHKLSKFAYEKEFHEGESIFEYNQACSHFFMLKKGDVYLLLPANPKEFSFAVSKIKAGELFGLSPLLNGDRYTAQAKCYSEAKVLAIEAKPFLELIRTNSHVGLNIINRVAEIYYARYLNILKKLQDVVSQVSLVR